MNIREAIKKYPFLKEVLKGIDEIPEVVNIYNKVGWTVFKRIPSEVEQHHYDGVRYFWGVLPQQDNYVHKYTVSGREFNRYYGSRLEMGESCYISQEGYEYELVPEIIVGYNYFQFSSDRYDENTKEVTISLDVYLLGDNANALYKEYIAKSRKEAEKDLLYPPSKENKEKFQNRFYKERFREEFPVGLDEIDLDEVDQIKVAKGGTPLFAQKGSNSLFDSYSRNNVESWKRFYVVTGEKSVLLMKGDEFFHDEEAKLSLSVGKQLLNKEVKKVHFVVQDSYDPEDEMNGRPSRRSIIIYQMPKGLFGRYLRKSRKAALAKKRNEE